MELHLDPIKFLKCKVCGDVVSVNANYPIEEVTCIPCYNRLKAEEGEQQEN